MKTNTEFNNKSWTQPLERQKVRVAAVFLLMFGSITHAAPWDVDPSFDPGSSLDGAVRTMAVTDDGKVLIGGFFSTVHGAMCSGLARLNADGSFDSSFPAKLAGTSPPGVLSLALQPDGKILIAGSFASVNDVARGNLARLNADGTPDHSFLDGLAGPNGLIQCMLLQRDGKILIAGSFTSVNGVARRNLARLNADGTLDDSFLDGLVEPNGSIYCMSLQSDGKLVIGGWLTSVNGAACTNLARLNPDGSVDDSFQAELLNPYGGALVYCLALQSDGRILVGGWLYSASSGLKASVARLNNDGSLDTNFVADMNPAFYPPYPLVTLQPDGKILIGGKFTSFNGMARTNLVRLNIDGTLDDSFSANLYHPPSYDGPNWYFQYLTCQPDGRILVSSGPDGVRVGLGGDSICRLNTDGSQDFSFDIGPTGPDGEVLDVAQQSDGRIIICGSFISVNEILRGHLARLMSDGSLDNTFLDHVSGADGDVVTVALQTDGKILVGGSFSKFNGEPHPGVVRLNADGSLDTAFLNGMTGPTGANSNWPGYVYGIGLQNDGKIIIAGSFSSVNGIARANIARLNTDGSLDLSFTASAGGSREDIHTLIIRPDEKILIGGDFTSVDGVSRNRIARLNTDGTLDASFYAAVDQPVLAIAVQDDGKILIGGSFTTVNGVAANGIARLHANGSLDQTFVPGLPSPGGWVYSIALPGDGTILMSGNLSTNGPLAQFARLNATGSVDSSCSGALLDPYAELRCVAVQGDGKVLITGDFTSVNQTPRSFIARLISDFLPPTILIPPRSQTSELGCTVEFIADVTNSFAATYEWFFNETNLVACGTNCEWVLTNCDFSQSGTYTLVVTNAFGAVTSAPVTLNVIPVVERRPVPAIKLMGDAGNSLNVEYTDALGPPANWLSLVVMNVTNSPQYGFDVTAPLPPQRFYRAWQSGTTSVAPSLSLPGMVPAITLTGSVGDSLRLDYINAIGPTDAWVTLGTVTLTNTSQLYFDTSSIGQPRRLYRILPGP